MMCVSNVIGFGFGVDGIHLVLQKIREDWMSMVASIATISVVVNVMFFQRSREKAIRGF